MSTFTGELSQCSKSLFFGLLLLQPEGFPGFSGLVHEVVLVVQDVLHSLDGERCNALVLLILLVKKGLLLKRSQGQSNLSGCLRGKVM